MLRVLVEGIRMSVKRFAGAYGRKYIGLVLGIVAACFASTGFAITPTPRVVNNNDTIILHGNVHPLARPDLMVGATDPSLPMDRMILSLRLNADKQAELEKLLSDQQDPASPNFHRWLTPEEFGAQFGPKPEDISTITAWLTSQGFTIDEVSKGRTWINFSGTVSQVETAFHTQMRDFNIDGQLRHANASDPAIPSALADLVSGVVSLHNIPHTSMIARIEPQYTISGVHSLTPGDFATIYNVSPLYAAGIDGAGLTIAIVGRTHPSSTNWSNFRSDMNLPANPPVVIVNGADPGDVSANEDGEADLDVEWSGAVARNATIKFVVSKGTNSTSGDDLSAQYIVNNNLAPVMSMSFGFCESKLGSVGNAHYNNLWAQAAAQGITSFVSSGDGGAAGCDAHNSSTATGGLAVNGLASTPYNVAVGGTQFNEGSGSYWNYFNATGGSSAKSYIPEVVWNESGNMSGGSGLWSTGGGASAIYPRPAWQVAPGVPVDGSPGVPVDGSRYVPDVSLSAASHDGYRIVTQGVTSVVGGTSAAAPAFAGLMALIVQKTGQWQGNANPRFYQLAKAQYQSGGAAVFHDIISGNNRVPGVTGYNAATGYDLATGLGSVDANALVNNWGNTTPAAATPVSPSGTISTATPTYTWSAVFNAIYYQLYVNGAATWYSAAQAGCGSGTGACSITGSALALGSYTWWVQTYNSYGYGPWSIGMNFTVSTGGTPAAATLVSPSGTITTTTPAYTWNAVSNATHYQVYANGAGTWYTASAAGCGSGTGTCSITASSALAAGNYTWYVQTWNSYGYGPWSSGMNFTVSATTTSASHLNDTGVTASQCYQAGSDTLVACNSAGALALNNAQDGMVGRDANAATNSNTDGKLGFSFTSVTGGCVQDNVTGLMWEVKTNDGGLRDWNKTYTKYSATYNPYNLYGAATDAAGFVSAVNASNLCGYSDWRLPTFYELPSIVDYGVSYSPGPTIDATWFPNTQGGAFWSSSPVAGYSNGGWYQTFGNSYVYLHGLDSSLYVRLVRAGTSPATPRYTVSADGQEVTDNQTKLIWRRCAEGMSWNGSTCTGVASTFTHEAALGRAAAQATGTGVAWRLPNAEELASIADISRSNPAIDPAAFPATPSNWFCSSSPFVGSSGYAYYVYFYDGSMDYRNRSYSYYVRLVRAGQ